MLIGHGFPKSVVFLTAASAVLLHTVWSITQLTAGLTKRFMPSIAKDPHS